MTAAGIAFHASASIAVVAGLAAMLMRRSDRALGGFAIAMAALLVPLIQLEAITVAGVLLLAATVIVVLLGALVGPGVAQERGPIAYWVLVGLGIAGFAWVLLATGSRQVVDHGDPLRDPRFGDGGALLLELGTDWAVPAVLVGLLALCAVIAAVVGLLRQERV